VVGGACWAMAGTGPMVSSRRGHIGVSHLQQQEGHLAGDADIRRHLGVSCRVRDTRMWGSRRITMPYLLGFLGLIVTVLILLSRLADAGIDLGGLNPFLTRRRRAWRQKFEANPLFGLDRPMDAAAVLAVGVAKADGDMSAEQKQALLAAFQQTFDIDLRAAEELLTSSAHLVGDGRILRDQVHDVIGRSKDQFTDSQIESTLSLLEEIAAVEGATGRQRELISHVESALHDQPTSGTWE